MVSIRRRRLLGFCSGTPKLAEATVNGRENPIHRPMLGSSFLAPFAKCFDNGSTPENQMQNTKLVTVHPMPLVDDDEKHEKESSKAVTDSWPSNDKYAQQFSEVKRRKPHRRKHFQSQETSVMRGVYFKNMKWQAAIKVDKKQIHLGTVGSQEEAAKLYDRAAFMCGREPNFELSEEEKQELTNYKWDEFLAITRSAITCKKHGGRRRTHARSKVEFSTPNSEWEEQKEPKTSSASEYAQTN